MKKEWIQRSGGNRAIVFFNGWGMDGSLFSCASAPAGWDVVMFHDYHRVAEPCGLEGLRDTYQRLVLVAWSMGVWAAACAQSTERVEFDRSVAINGTCRPIDDRYGIPRAAYRATAARFSERARDVFYRRMCGDGEFLRRFEACLPQCALDDQRSELLAIRTQFGAAGEPAPYVFDRAFVGTGDAIVPGENQQRFWKPRAAVRTLDMPHFPFFHLTWAEIVNDDLNDR